MLGGKLEILPPDARLKFVLNYKHLIRENSAEAISETVLNLLSADDQFSLILACYKVENEDELRYWLERLPEEHQLPFRDQYNYLLTSLTLK